MMEGKCMAISERAKLFISRIEDGTIQKRHLPNHGDDYTNGPEGIATRRFDRYIVSCGYRLMQNRIGMEKNKYYG